MLAFSFASEGYVSGQVVAKFNVGALKFENHYKCF